MSTCCQLLRVVLVLITITCVFSTGQEDPCSSGPTFWCATVPNAQECNETEFCQKFCWSPREFKRNLKREYMKKTNMLPSKRFLQLCYPDKKRIILPSKPTNPAFCDECKVAITQLDKLLKNKEVIDSITVALRFFCNLLPVYSTQCREIVTDLSDLINILEPHLRDPEKLCTQLHVCVTSDYFLLDNNPVEEFLHKYYTSDLNVTLADNTLCDDCVTAINSAKAQLEDPAQQKNIMDTFHDFCSYFGPLKKPCDDYVDDYVPELLRMMIAYLSDAQGVCSRLGFCTITL